VNAESIFGCSNVRNKQYCILNRQYSKEAYAELVPKIIEHMKKTGEWGEFFPPMLSPFAYNETVAQEYFPLTRKDIEMRGWRWKEDDKREFQPQTVEVSHNIDDIQDTLCSEILACEVTGRNYRIIPQELEFYRKIHLPIPRRHPDQRHRDRIAKRNPRRLWKRICSKCREEIWTSYPPKSPYTVYCEKCYLKEKY
jgi:hypothetical protein